MARRGRRLRKERGFTVMVNGKPFARIKTEREYQSLLDKLKKVKKVRLV